MHPMHIVTTATNVLCVIKIQNCGATAAFDHLLSRLAVLLSIWQFLKNLILLSAVLLMMAIRVFCIDFWPLAIN